MSGDDLSEQLTPAELRSDRKRLGGTVIHGYARRGNTRPEFACWLDMIRRCTKRSASGFKNYGGRGIYVVPEWLEFTNFIRDMGDRPGPGYTIERKDNDGPYAPWNCVWATRAEQGNNRRTNRIIEIQGERLNLTQWAARIGLKAGTVRHWASKWPIERVTDRILCELSKQESSRAAYTEKYGRLGDNRGETASAVMSSLGRSPKRRGTIADETGLTVYAVAACLVRLSKAGVAVQSRYGWWTRKE